jgi:hypothetical protein
VDLSKCVMSQIDAIDRRHMEFAMDEAKRQASGQKLCVVVGALIFSIGIIAAIYLGMSGHEFIALSISLPLATIVAVVVGNRFLKS